MNKRELLDRLNTKPSWGSKEVRLLVNSTSGGIDPNNCPVSLQVGDFFYDGRVSHPSLIVEKRGEMFLTIGLTSSDVNAVTIINSRYKKTSYAYPSISLTDVKGMECQYMGSVTEDEAKRIKAAVFNSFRNAETLD